MTKIYVAAYKEFGDYKTLKKIYDYFLCKLDKEDVIFYVSTGESGDNTCMKYIRENKYKYIDWLPQKKGKNRAEEKFQYIKDSDHAILITDGNSVGIGVALNYACRFIVGKVVSVRIQCNDLTVFQVGKKPKTKKLDEI